MSDEFKVESGQLQASMNATGIIQVVKLDVEDYQVSYLFRVKDDTPGEKVWQKLVKEMLLAELAAKGKWTIWVARRYFLKPVSGEQTLVYGWVLIISGDLEAALASLKQALDAKAAELNLRFELESMPLPHVSNRNRNAPTEGGKGAAPIGSVPQIMKRGR